MLASVVSGISILSGKSFSQEVEGRELPRQSLDLQADKAFAYQDSVRLCHTNWHGMYVSCLLREHSMPACRVVNCGLLYGQLLSVGACLPQLA